MPIHDMFIFVVTHTILDVVIANPKFMFYVVGVEVPCLLGPTLAPHKVPVMACFAVIFR